jgi:hypothetical protein
MKISTALCLRDKSIRRSKRAKRKKSYRATFNQQHFVEEKRDVGEMLE